MAAPVRLEAEAFTDPRIQLLADLGGWTRYEALGRLAFLWSACTERQLYYVPEAIVRGCLGMNGANLLCDADLAERTPDGLRIRGTAGRVEWLGELREKRQRAGRARAECVNRDTLGRMQSNNQPAHAGDPSSTHPAPSSAPTLVPVPALVLTQVPDPEKSCSPPAREPRPPRAPKPPSGPHQQAIAAFDAYYRRSNSGAKPTWGGKNAALMARLLALHGIDEINRRLELLERAPPKFPPPPWDMAMFSQHFDKLVPSAPQGLDYFVAVGRGDIA